MRDKQNKLTPGANLIWESSRMMLPEHKEEILRHRKELKRKERPYMDEQKMADIDRALQYSMHHRSEVELVVFGDYEDRQIRGKVCWIDRLQVKLASAAGGFEWVESADILEVIEPF